jgi:hypothetical protein
MTRSQNQEKRICRSLKEILADSVCTPASGAGNVKSDVVSELFRIEAKTKDRLSKSIKLEKEWFDKIFIEAVETKRIPVLAFSFGNKEDFYALRGNDFFALMSELIEGRNEKKI